MFLCFQTADVKMLVTACQCFHQSPTKLCQDLVSFACWIVAEFWSFTHKSALGHSRSKLCPILCRLHTKLCPNFGRSRARLCPISFVPCPFPNLAGTLDTDTTTGIQGAVAPTEGSVPRRIVPKSRQCH